MKCPPQKRKVQAQRKFAQGAFIPPSNNAAVPVKTDAPAPAKEERRSIIHSNLSAKSLLDIVSFQSIHTHSDPVVVLERLTPTAENSSPAPARHEPQKQMALPKISKTIPRTTPNKVTKTIHKAKISRMSKPTKLRRRLKMKYAMLLRSRETVLRKERSSTSDLEDDRPLKYLKLMRAEPQPAAAPPPQTPPETRHKPAKKQSPDKDGGRITRSAKHQEQQLNIKKSSSGEIPKKNLAKASSNKETTTETAKLKESPRQSNNHVEKETPSAKTVQSPSKTLQALAKTLASISKTPQSSAKTPQSPAKTPQSSAKTPQSPAKAFKEPALPARFTRPNPDKNKNAAESSNSRQTNGTRQTTANPIAGPSKKSAAPEKGESSKRTGNRQQFYGDTGIKRWLNSNKGKTADADKGKSKAAAKPAQEEAIDLSSEAPTDSRAPSPCPSESLVTFSDVLSASRTVLSRRCQRCPHCKRVSTAQQISTLMQRSRVAKDKANDNVYDFDPDEETTNNLKPFVFNRKRKARRQSAERDANAGGSSDADDDPPVYLDLNKEFPKIIEMTRGKVPGSDKKIMKARLIPKSEASPAGEFSLMENEIMLEEMLQVLQYNYSQQHLQYGGEENSDAAAAAATPADAPTTSSAAGPSTSAAGVEPPPPADNRRRTRGAAAQEPDTPDEQTDKPSPAKLLEAPVFFMTEAEFTDPIAFFEKITPQAAKYGLCKVVAPASFKPECILNDALKFNVTNHYISRLFSRWGAAAREITAMRAYLATQNINFNRVPLLDGLEVNLPKLYSVVQRYGGLQQVMGKRLWSKVAEEMRFSKGPNTEKILDNYYMKYLLPYDTASDRERAEILNEVEKSWTLKHRKLQKWSADPLHHARKLLGEAESSDDEPADDTLAGRALHEAEDCIVAGRPMHLSGFKKVAAHAMTMYMGKSDPTWEEVEKEYWRLVLLGTEHVCVNAASIDTAASGYGFSKTRCDPGWKHPWNLKNLNSNTNNLLRSLNAVLGVTVPTLHLGMVFSTCCWHRDPHGLPWIEYMHSGPTKIWYGIPDEQSVNFRHAVEQLCPTSCQQKDIWLSSDITMIPPNLLREHKVTLSRVIQSPGEYIIVFPKSYTCSISTGFTVSESVYFATTSWLKTVHQVFQELRSSYEPTTFSLEQLLLALAKDPRSSFGVLHTVHSSLTTIVDEEIRHRNNLRAQGVIVRNRQAKKRNGAAWNVREQDECQVCRTTLFLSKVTGVLSKKSDMCLLHALQVIELRKPPREEIEKMEMYLFYSEKQLNEIVAQLQKRLFP